MKYLKRFENYNNDELLEEGWKNWALALGIAASSLVSNNANASTQGIGDDLRDKIENLKGCSGLTIKKLEKDGYSPVPGTLIPSDKKLVDSGIESTGKTKSTADEAIKSLLRSKGIDFGNIKSGFFVYKEIGQKISVKWISFQ